MEDIRRIILLTLFIILVAPNGYAQRKHRSSSNPSARVGWRIFSPPNKNFRVEVPVRLHRIKDMFGDSDPHGYKSIEVYGGRLKSKSFLVVMLTPSEGMRGENPNGNDLSGLQFVIGGDDAAPLSEKEIIVGGLRGKEFTYTHTKGRIIDGGDRVFVLAFSGVTDKDGSSLLMAKFFDSFRVLSKAQGISKGPPNNSFNRSGMSLDFIVNLDAIRRFFPPG